MPDIGGGFPNLGISDFLGGLFGSEPSDPQLRELYMQMFNQPGQQAAQGGVSGFRQNQQNLIGRLEAMASGQGPSLAGRLLEQSADRGANQAAGLAVSGRGNAGAAQFNAANQAGMMRTNAAQQASVARIQEQQMALNQLGLTLHGARGADEDMSRFNAGQQNQMGQFNQGLRMQALGGMGAIPRTPGLGNRLLGGGANLLAQYATMGGGGGGGYGGPQGYPTNYDFASGGYY